MKGDLYLFSTTIDIIQDNLEQLANALYYVQISTATELITKLENNRMLIEKSEFSNLHLILKHRYFLCMKDHHVATKIWDEITAKRHHFSYEDNYLVNFNEALLLMHEKKYRQADCLLLEVLVSKHDTKYLQLGELYATFSKVKFYLKREREAIFYGQLALEHLRESFNVRRIIQMYNQLTKIYTYLKLYKQALIVIDHLLEFKNLAVIAPASLPIIYHNRALILEHLGDFKQAFIFYQKALAYAEEKDTIYAEIYFNYCHLLYRSNQDICLFEFNQLLSLAEQLHHPSLITIIKFYLKQLTKDHQAHDGTQLASELLKEFIHFYRKNELLTKPLIYKNHLEKIPPQLV